MHKEENLINQIWDNPEQGTFLSPTEASEVVNNVLKKIDSGVLRVSEKHKDTWVVNEWVKKAILLSFKYNNNEIIDSFDQSKWYDKVDSKFNNWTKEDFSNKLIRAVPGSYVRKGSFVGENCVLMPSFVNIGAHVGSGTMVDTWATIGSCAQIGKHCHISGGVGIGGVLEPLQASPVIIEDNCFIGARSEVAEGVIVREGSVLSMGVFLSQSTKIYNRETKEITYGEIPPYSVVVPGSLPSKTDGVSLYAAIIVKTVDSRTREKTSVNNLLRENV